MNEEQKPSPHRNKILFQYVLLLFCAYLGFVGLMGKPIAIYKSKSSDNILQGCFYYDARNAKGDHMGRINNEFRSTLQNMYIKSFPASKKNDIIPYFDYSKLSHCYKVKYIIVDFNVFTNHSFFKRYYIYDYVDY